MEKNIDIPPFYIGQEIVAIRDHSQGVFKKGDEFRITSISKASCSCKGKWLVTIGIPKTSSLAKCHFCYTILEITGSEWVFGSLNFAPKFKLGEFVSMKEVVQLETVCAN